MTGISAVNHARSTLVETYTAKRLLFFGKLTGDNRDTFSFSAAGMRLNLLFNGQKIEKISVRSWEPILGASSPLNKEDRQISQTGKYLERMLAIAEAAEDPELSDLERIEMQMELGQLQHDMDSLDPRNTGLMGLYQDTNSYKMLARALDRISGGREWNVAEVRSTILEAENANAATEDPWLFSQLHVESETPDGVSDSYDDVKALYDTEGDWIEYLRERRPEWKGDDVYFEKPLTSERSFWLYSGMPSDDENAALTALGFIWEKTADPTVPTVGEILQGTGRSVMDAESAAETAEKLKQDLKGLEKQREELVRLAAEYAEVEQEPDDSEDKRAVLERMTQFSMATLPDFVGGLYRESFQFTYGERYNMFGQTEEEVKAEREATAEGSALDLGTAQEWDRPKVTSIDVQIPGKSGF